MIVSLLDPNPHPSQLTSCTAKLQPMISTRALSTIEYMQNFVHRPNSHCLLRREENLFINNVHGSRMWNLQHC